MTNEVRYSVAETRDQLSAILRRVQEGTEIAVITNHGKVVAKIVASDVDNTPKGVTGMTRSQIQKALAATDGYPEMLRKILELFI